MDNADKAPVCEHCKHYHDETTRPGYYYNPYFSPYKCRRRKVWSPVHGWVDDTRDASKERESSRFRDLCGADAKYYEAK